MFDSNVGCFSFLLINVEGVFLFPFCSRRPPLAAQVAPLLIEDPPSTADEDDDELLRVATVAVAVPGVAGAASTELLVG